MSLSNYLENAVANALRGGGNGQSLTAPTAVYAQLHTGDPGEDGTANVFGDTTRKEVQFGAASNGVISLSNAPSWPNLSASGTLTHVSLWDHPTTGNCLGSGALDAPVLVNAGGTFNLTGLTVTIT